MRVNYKHPTKLTKRDKKKKRLQKALDQKAKEQDTEMQDSENARNVELSRAKRK